MHLIDRTTDEFRFCCLARHVETCYPAPESLEFSSCEDLMSNSILRVCIWVLGVVALVGNITVILWRTKYRITNKVHSFLIINLALGDLLMGIYMLIIAGVDAYYRGIYFIVDAMWRQSTLCHFAGFLSTLSSEFSVFTLTVITLDRFVTIVFPLKFRKIKMKNACIIMSLLWIVCIALSAVPLVVPLMDLNYFDNFYGRSGVCLALHITQERPNGWEYSVFVFLVLNFLSFTTIAIAYLWMFFVAKNTTIAVRTPEHKIHNRMARRMMFIVMTDFWCWMPIILLGIISFYGVKIPPQAFAWVAVFVLPLNAAVNPTLYTLSTLVYRKKSSTPQTVSLNRSFKARNHYNNSAPKHNFKTSFI
ncbi:unnamed protein product [Oppiella nova]|uniref:G-protein coupled receptors family 1 profile domain-containing protein n=1 Tax=Oppiella nova TaxID=334625 RepID=A0A7R9QSP2_9ACAR|nr:unnamed protein product [Oppiella nova]CAG2173986.1 unnamed protein product [Oppiella nova]